MIRYQPERIRDIARKLGVTPSVLEQYLAQKALEGGATSERPRARPQGEAARPAVAQ